MRTKILGLTGGIATGKSTVSQIMQNYHLPIIDADLVARQVVLPGTRGIAEISRQFGESFINDDKTLNRHKLGELVFANSVALNQLNRILQPLIRAEIARQINLLKQKQPALIVLDIPLLFEQHREGMVDYVMVVTTSKQQQLERLMERNHLTKQQAQNRIDSQLPLSLKMKRADIVIDNSGLVEETRRQVVEWLANQQFI